MPPNPGCMTGVRPKIVFARCTTRPVKQPATTAKTFSELLSMLRIISVSSRLVVIAASFGTLLVVFCVYHKCNVYVCASVVCRDE